MRVNPRGKAKGQAVFESLISLPLALAVTGVVIASLVYSFFKFQIAHFRNEYEVCLRSQLSNQVCQSQAIGKIQSLSQALGLETQILPASGPQDAWMILTRWRGWHTFILPERRLTHREALH